MIEECIDTRAVGYIRKRQLRVTGISLQSDPRFKKQQLTARSLNERNAASIDAPRQQTAPCAGLCRESFVKIELLIKGQAPDPHLGVFNGSIEEGVNRVTRIELSLVSEHEYKESDLEDMVGAPATVKLSAPIDNSLSVSRFDGIVYEMHQMNRFDVDKDLFAYRLIIRPWIWQFHIGRNSRSFPKKRRIDVIDTILQGGKGKYYDTDYYKESDYPELWQILQDEISDWDFVQKLMREGGINYYFGAPKDGNTAEMMHLVDSSSFFPNALKKAVPWNPTSGLSVSDPHIHAFETVARAVPKSVESTASFGDGIVRRFASTSDVQKGTGGTFRNFGVEGQEETVAKHQAKVLSQGFSAARLTFHGVSNHFLIRAGERIAVGGPYLDSEKKVIVTAVRHHFHCTIPAAVEGKSDAEYENIFVAVKSDAEIRPVDELMENINTVGGSLGTSTVRAEKHHAGGEIDVLKNSMRNMAAALDRLVAADQAVGGVMLGDVDEDTKVTSGKEMTCRISNERFPDGLTAKVSVAWLVPGGGVTCLPREGMQVYFIFEQGQGGQNEAVVVGYRPSSGVPGQNPASKTETNRLKRGSAADQVVEKDSFSPKNRERVGIRGEDAVCEVTLLDAEKSVSVNAEKDLYFIADEAVHLRSDSHLHMADTVGEQFGSVDRYVDRDQTEWIKGNHDMTVTGDQSLTIEGNQTITVEKDVTEQIGGAESHSVTKSRTVTIEQDHTRTVSGNETITVSKGRFLTTTANYEETVNGKKIVAVAKDYTEEIGGAETRTVTKNASLSSDEAISFTAQKKVTITCGDAKVTIEKSGDITIEGKKMSHKASGDITMKGSKIKIN
jgi:uncharacterized protein involved in type VI secretion and phage assembly